MPRQSSVPWIRPKAGRWLGIHSAQAKSPNVLRAAMMRAPAAALAIPAMIGREYLRRMAIGDLFVRGMIWLSLLAWVAAEWARCTSRGMKPAGRGAWTVGALAALGHTAAAFHFRHGWSQRA